MPLGILSFLIYHIKALFHWDSDFGVELMSESEHKKADLEFEENRLKPTREEALNHLDPQQLTEDKKHESRARKNLQECIAN